MDVGFLFIGGLLILAALITALAFLDGKSIVFLGIALLLGAAGGLSVRHGIQLINRGFSDKHAAIYRDVTAQGFKVPTDSVYAVGGNFLWGTEVDIVAGKCTLPFNATLIEGKWRVTLPSRDGNGVTVISPSDLSSFAQACG